MGKFQVEKHSATRSFVPGRWVVWETVDYPFPMRLYRGNYATKAEATKAAKSLGQPTGAAK